MDLGASCHFAIGADAWVDERAGDVGCDDSGGVFARSAGAWRDSTRTVDDRECGRRRALNCALLFMVISHALLALAPSVPVVALALFLEMFAGLLWNVVAVSYRQRFIPDALLGRVNNIYRFFGWGLLPFGALAAGAIVVLAEPEIGRALALRMPFVVATIGSFAIFVYALFWFKIDRK